MTRLTLPTVPTGVLAASALVISLGCGDDAGDLQPEPPNRPPRLEARTDTTATVGDTLRLQARAIDPDDDPLRYGMISEISATEFQEGYFPAVGMEGASGRFWYTPAARDRPGRNFRFTVEDDRGGADTTRFQVTVD
jgi:hypothetical protein